MTWSNVLQYFSAMDALGIATLMYNGWHKAYIERKSLDSWKMGLVASSIVGSILIGCPFLVVAAYSDQPDRKEHFVKLALAVGFMLPLWFDAVLTIFQVATRRTNRAR